MICWHLISDDRSRIRPVRSTYDWAEALEANRSDCRAVYWTPNDPSVRHDERRADRIPVARFVFADVDCGPDDSAKRGAIARAKALPTVPTAAVDSGNGIHFYWRTSVAAELWDSIVKWRVVPAVGGDPKATDRSRLLRAPGSMNMKDANNPRPVRVLWKSRRFVESDELLALPEVKPVVKPAPVRTVTDADDFYTVLEALDQRHVLEVISGSWLVGGETLEFVRAPRGRYNLVADGKATSNFIDSAGRIGARSTSARHDGGPLVSTWARFYGHDDRTIRSALIAMVPELARFGEVRRVA